MIDRSWTIGVLMGGMASERAISFKSGRAVAEALREKGWKVVEIDMGRDLPAQLIANEVKAAWLALHGRFGEDGCVQGLLEVMGIPYTGSGVRASAVAMDKIATKRAMAGAPNVVMARDWVLHAGEPLPSDLALPVVVKPAIGGSSLGIVRVDTDEELKAALDVAFALDPAVLLETFVGGEEITVAVLDGEALPVVRIVPESGFFDYEAKYTEGKTSYEVPGAVSEATARMAKAAAISAWHRVGCRGLARADFIVRPDGVPVFLEINTIPGMTATSLSPMAAEAVGIDFATLAERLLLSATCMPPEEVLTA